MNRMPTTRGVTSFIRWTDDRCQQLAQLWTEGWSALEIGQQLGCSRNAVLGKAHRMKLKPRREGYNVDARKRRFGESKPRQKAERLPRSNIVGRVSSRGIKRQAPPKVVALPVQGISDATLIAGWLAQHGGPRKFERGDSGHPDAIQFFLRDRGYTMAQRYHGGVFVRFPDGRSRRMKMKQLIAFVDGLRIEEGLEPIAA